MANMDSTILSNIFDHSSRANRSSTYFNCRPCRFVRSWSSEYYYERSGNPKFSERYVLGQKLGAGAYSTVKEGYHKERNTMYAIKIVEKNRLSNEDKFTLKNEVEILQSLNHPHIVRLYSVYREVKYYYFVMEYLRGGEMFERLLSKKKYSEDESRKVAKVLLDAIKYCHDRNIAHRDLKPENLLLMHSDNDCLIKIADFGFAKRVPSGGGLTTRCGSPNYVAPEIISRTPYGTQVDMWSIGVIIYIILCGELPFADRNRVMLYRKIRMARYNFSKDSWINISKSARCFVSSLLVVDPEERYTAAQALDQNWMKPRPYYLLVEKEQISTGELTESTAYTEEDDDISTASSIPNNKETEPMRSNRKVSKVVMQRVHAGQTVEIRQ